MDELWELILPLLWSPMDENGQKWKVMRSRGVEAQQGAEEIREISEGKQKKQNIVQHRPWESLGSTLPSKNEAL